MSLRGSIPLSLPGGPGVADATHRPASGSSGAAVHNPWLNSGGRSSQRLVSGWGTRVEVRVALTDLVNLDHFSKSDPFVVLFQERGKGNWVEKGRTEVVWDNLDPSFTTAFVLDYSFQEVQNLKFVVYDHSGVARDLRNHKFIGEATMTLGRIVGAGGRATTEELHYPKSPFRHNGLIHVTAEEVRDFSADVHMQFSCSNLRKVHPFGIDPFVTICRERAFGTEGATAQARKTAGNAPGDRGSTTRTSMGLDGSHSHVAGPAADEVQKEFVPVHTTEAARRTCHPQFAEFRITGQQLCNGDHDRTLLFQVYDRRRSGRHVLVGEFTTTLANLQELENLGAEGGDSEFELVKWKKNKCVSGGTFVFQSFKIVHEPTFLDYVAGGCEINLVVALDFTLSNGHPAMPKSLHHRRADSHIHVTEYTQAITAVGDILAHYDSDKLFPVYGFGAKLPPNYDQVSHCFNVNLHPTNPEVQHVEGIVDAYLNALDVVKLAGPTHFTPVLEKAVAQARQHASQHDQKYTILLVITDGVINDLDETIAGIVEASHLPLSIVIVGVGDADFTDMHILDADDVPLTANGNTMVRDIVQFVPFAKYAGTPSLLAQETLEEIPGQFISYMRQQGIKPNPPPDGRKDSSTGGVGGDTSSWSHSNMGLSAGIIKPSRLSVLAMEEGVVQGKPGGEGAAGTSPVGRLPLAGETPTRATMLRKLSARRMSLQLGQLAASAPITPPTTAPKAPPVKSGATLDPGTKHVLRHMRVSSMMDGPMIQVDGEGKPVESGPLPRQGSLRQIRGTVGAGEGEDGEDGERVPRRESLRGVQSHAEFFSDNRTGSRRRAATVDSERPDIRDLRTARPALGPSVSQAAAAAVSAQITGTGGERASVLAPRRRLNRALTVVKANRAFIDAGRLRGLSQSYTTPHTPDPLPVEESRIVSAPSITDDTPAPKPKLGDDDRRMSALLGVSSPPGARTRTRRQAVTGASPGGDARRGSAALDFKYATPDQGGDGDALDRPAVPMLRERDRRSGLAPPPPPPVDVTGPGEGPPLRDRRRSALAPPLPSPPQEEEDDDDDEPSAAGAGGSSERRGSTAMDLKYATPDHGAGGALDKPAVPMLRERGRRSGLAPPPPPPPPEQPQQDESNQGTNTGNGRRRGSAAIAELYSTPESADVQGTSPEVSSAPYQSMRRDSNALAGQYPETFHRTSDDAPEVPTSPVLPAGALSMIAEDEDEDEDEGKDGAGNVDSKAILSKQPSVIEMAEADKFVDRRPTVERRRLEHDDPQHEPRGLVVDEHDIGGGGAGVRGSALLQRRQNVQSAVVTTKSPPAPATESSSTLSVASPTSAVQIEIESDVISPVSPMTLPLVRTPPRPDSYAQRRTTAPAPARRSRTPSPQGRPPVSPDLSPVKAMRRPRKLHTEPGATVLSRRPNTLLTSCSDSSG